MKLKFFFFFLGNGCIEGKELEHFIRELEQTRKSAVSHIQYCVCSLKHQLQPYLISGDLNVT